MKRLLSTLAISLAALLVTGVVSAQTEQTPEVILDEPIEVEEEAPEAIEEDIDSREVDYSEENFRRSMELRDRELQRARGLGDSSVSTTSGLQALEGLPESSQKHLREQLREIIVEEGPWKPEDADVVYPYVPSEAAGKDGSLKLREENAWGELVAKYHEREAEIHRNSPRTAAATGNPAGADSPPESMGENTGEDMGEAGDTGTDESAERRAERQAALDSLLNSGTPSAESGSEQAQSAATEGVSQNALQLLQQRQQVPEGAESASESASAAQQQSRQVAQSSQSAESSSANASDATSSEADRSVELDLESEGVIAIRDLEKIDLEEARENENP